MGTALPWVGFLLLVFFLLALDLGVFHRRAHAVKLREAAAWCVFWVLLALVFNLALFYHSGRGPAIEFSAGYLIEISLSVDNLFVFILLFRYFGVESRYQHRLLFWGILGALLMRGMMIGAGVALIHRFEWILYLFGAFLVYAGTKMLRQKDEQVHPEHNPVLRWARKFLPIAKDYHGEKLFVRRGMLWIATPLFLVLLVVETTDLAFAVDSIPAVFGVTRNPFIVVTSNVFAILGLRAFYFLLAGVLPYFRYLGTGLSIVLMFIGAKMLAARWIEIPTHIALAIVGGVLATAVTASIIAARRSARRQPKEEKQRVQAHGDLREVPPSELIARLASPQQESRNSAAAALYMLGTMMSDTATRDWLGDSDFSELLVRHGVHSANDPARRATTVGVVVTPERFAVIRAANASPRLADVPPDQDAMEFELHFPNGVRLDILTTKAHGGGGAIARFLEKFGEGIQQVEYEVTNVDRATEIVRTRFGRQPVYPETRAGADGTRVNFFLAATPGGKKVLIELVEVPRRGSS